MAACSDRYNRIGFIGEQKSRLQSISLPSILYAIAQIIQNHQAHVDFGIALLHRHYDLPDGYAMVHSSGNSEEDTCTMERFGTRQLYPCSYHFDSRGFHPFEFSSAPTPVPRRDFLLEIAAFLQSRGLCHIFGLSHVRRTQEPWSERLSPDGRGTIATRQPHGIDFSMQEEDVTEWIIIEGIAGMEVKAFKTCVDTEAGHKRQ